MRLFLIALVALQAPPAEEGWLPTQNLGAIQARLAVRVKPVSPAPGYAEVTLRVEIAGPAALEVMPAKLTGPDETWEEKREAIRKTPGKDGPIVVQVIQLTQLKPGITPLPAVSVRFREGSQAPWQEAQWTNLLAQTQETLSVLEPPDEPVAPPSAPLWPWIVGGIALVSSIVLLRRRRRGPVPEPSFQEQALAELARLEARQRREPDGRLFHSDLSLLLRRYLAQRYELAALQQTTSELRKSIDAAPGWTDERKAVVFEVLQRCDEARFARVVGTNEDCQRLVDAVRGLIRTEPEA